MDYFAWMPQGLSTDSVALLALILGLSALMSGLSGFGFSAIGAICLWLLPPTQAIPLLMALSMFNQFASIKQLTADMLPLRQWWPNGPGPYLLGGLVGAPVGLSILYALPTAALMATFGGFLLVYACYSLLVPVTPRIQSRGWFIPMLVGAAGGIIGGFTAFPGAAVVVWTSLCGMPKSQSRAIVQPYILALQIVSLGMVAIQHPSTFGTEFWKLLTLMLPVVLPFTLLGVFLYKSLSDVNFRRIAFLLLGVSGGGIFYKGMASLTMVAAVVTPAVMPSATGPSVVRKENVSELQILYGTELPRSSERLRQTRQAVKNACDLSGSTLFGMGHGRSASLQSPEPSPSNGADHSIVVFTAINTALNCPPHLLSASVDRNCTRRNGSCVDQEGSSDATPEPRRKTASRGHRPSRYARHAARRHPSRHRVGSSTEANCLLFGPDRVE
jgi:uncharacterized protein